MNKIKGQCNLTKFNRIRCAVQKGTCKFYEYYFELSESNQMSARTMGCLEQKCQGTTFSKTVNHHEMQNNNRETQKDRTWMQWGHRETQIHHDEPEKGIKQRRDNTKLHINNYRGVQGCIISPFCKEKQIFFHAWLSGPGRVVLRTLWSKQSRGSCSCSLHQSAVRLLGRLAQTIQAVGQIATNTMPHIQILRSKDRSV